MKGGEIKRRWPGRHADQATQSLSSISCANLLAALGGPRPAYPGFVPALSCSRQSFGGPHESLADPGGSLFGSRHHEYPCAARLDPFSALPCSFAIPGDLLERLCELRERLLCPCEFPFYWHSYAGHIRHGDGHPTTRACCGKRDAGDNDNGAARRVSSACPG